MEDRKRILTLPLPSTECQMVLTTSDDVTSSVVAGVLKPILIDKQLSEPSSPTTKTSREVKPQKPRQMHRGHSDLGSRVKKRVTLRSVTVKLNIYDIFFKSEFFYLFLHSFGSSISPQMVNLDEATGTSATTKYTTSTSRPRDDGVVIIVPNLPDVMLEGSSSFRGTKFNGGFGKSTGEQSILRLTFNEPN